MNTCGFRQYGALSHIKYVKHKPLKEVVSDIRDKNDEMLDLVFSVDPLTNLPCGSIDQYLSDKTRDEVRLFIERYLLVDLPDTSMSVPPNLREDLLSLDSDFIAKVSRNRYESTEDYEARVQKYFNELEEDKKFKSAVAKLKSSRKNDE